MNIKKLINAISNCIAYLRRLFHKPTLTEELEKLEGVIMVIPKDDYIIVECDENADGYKIIKIARIFNAYRAARITSPNSNSNIIKHVIKWKTKVK